MNNNTVLHLPPFTNYIYRVTPTLPSLFVNRELVSNCAIRHLKEGKACRPDNLGGRELRLIGDVFIGSFFIIARKNFADWKFPQQWKTAQVKCIHKKDSQFDCGNYRPISLLSQPSKLLESLVCKQMDFFPEHNNLFSNSQRGFRKGRSTELLLLHMPEKWTFALNQKKSVGVIVIDFQKPLTVFPINLCLWSCKPLASASTFSTGS